MLNDITGLIAVALGLSLPIVTIVMHHVERMKSKASDAELRKTIVQSGVDAETAKVIISENASGRKKQSKFAGMCVILVLGCALVGSGLGGYIGNLGFRGQDTILFTAIGCGLGLIAAFIAIWKMYPKLKNYNTEENPKDEQ